MIKFFIDENISFKVTKYLRNLGYDAVDVRDLNLKGVRNSDLLKVLIQQERIFITFDLDFSNLYNPMIKEVKGIIILRTRRFSSNYINRILNNFLTSHNIENIKNKLVIVTDTEIRIREIGK